MKSPCSTIALVLLLPEAGASARGPAAKRLRERTIYRSDARSLRADAGGRDAAAAPSNGNRQRRLQRQAILSAPPAEKPDNLFDPPRLDAPGGLSTPNLDFSFSYLSFELGNVIIQATGVDADGSGPSSTPARPEIPEWKAMARLIWSDASKDFTFDSLGSESTCGWGDDQECVPLLAYIEEGAGAHDACEKAMISAFRDPRLDRNIEKHILFDSDTNVFDIGCASLIAASEDAYPSSDELNNARSTFLDGSDVNASNPFNIRPIDENDGEETYDPFLGIGSMSMESMSMGSVSVGSMSMGSTPMSISLPINTTAETPEVEMSMPTTTAPPNAILVGTSYCTYAPDKTCYIDGWPSCCGGAGCPIERPPCEVEEPYDPFLGMVSMPMGSKPMGSKPVESKPTGSSPMGSMSMESMPMGPISMSMSLPATTTVEPSGLEMSMPTATAPTNPTVLGASYCTYAPDTTCYVDGWPSCCGGGSCPIERPPCDATAVTSKPTFMPTKIPTGFDEEVPAPSTSLTCSFCSGGLMVEDTVIIPGTNETTCGMAEYWASSLEETSFGCAVLKDSEFICCPTVPEVPCSFCAKSNGVSVAEDLAIPQGDGITCGSAALYAASIEDASEECAGTKLVEYICCPNVVEDPCIFCADGFGVEDTLFIPDTDGMTCELAGRYASSIEASADECRTLQLGEAACCPTLTEKCPFCTDGLTVDPGYTIGDTTCGLAGKYASSISVENEECASLQLSEQFCCPLLTAETSFSLSKSPSGEPSYPPSMSPVAADPITTTSPVVPPSGSSGSDPPPPATPIGSPPLRSVSSAMNKGSFLLASVVAATAVFQLL